ncbi:MAG: hypothetical protein PUD53_08550 [Oscillospiraceae bacterium]|nr:hypothetical protein [Oscillospiraceae bacterium]
MSMTNTNKENINLLTAANFLKAYSEIKMLETTSQQILNIIRDAKTQGKERYYCILINITDILNNSKTEQELIQKLNKAYPMR